MPRPQVDLKPFKGLITTWFNDDISSDDIAKRLANDHGIICTACTIERRLKE
jgi:phosphoribosylformylglycinamidine (FGAM) synthase PurS component